MNHVDKADFNDCTKTTDASHSSLTFPRPIRGRNDKLTESMLRPSYMNVDHPTMQLDAMINVDIPKPTKANLSLVDETNSCRLDEGFPVEPLVGFTHQPVNDEMKRVKVDALSGKGSKYWLAGDINGQTATCFADSGADISLFPSSETDGLEMKELPEKFEISGFRDKEVAVISHTVDVEINFCPGVLNATFYVCDLKNIILGGDILQNPQKNVSLNTGERYFSVNEFKLHTSRSQNAAKKEHMRRKGMNVDEYLSEFDDVCEAIMRTNGRVYLPPLECVDIVSSVTDRKKMRDGHHSMLSYFDEGQADIFIPSLTFFNDELDSCRAIPVTNLTKKGFYLPKDFILGKVVPHSDDGKPNESGKYEVYNVNELREEIERRQATVENAESVRDKKSDKIQIHTVGTADLAAAREKAAEDAIGAAGRKAAAGRETNDDAGKRVAESACSSNSAAAEGSGTAAETPAVDAGAKAKAFDEEGILSEPVKFSDMVGVGKLDQQIFAQSRKYGIKMDYNIEQSKPNIYVKEVVEPDYTAERLKGQNCPYWKNRAEFLELFALSHIDPVTRAKIEDLLWAYRHIWYNPATPEQFREGLKNVKPVVIKRIPGAVPKKEPLRQLSPEKIRLLEIHLNELKEMGVILPCEDAEYSSPIHLVLESRYSVKDKKNIQKARVTIDLRSMNECLSNLCYPIPSTEEFRRHMSQYKIYSSVDGTKYFYQIKIDETCSKECFCITAVGRVWRMVRLCMGAKVSPSIAQCIADLIFRNHSNCRAYLDDFTTFSQDMDSHLIHLEKTFALCGTYGVLLACNKADLATNTMRNLGFQVAKGETSMCGEKLTKIDGLIFPKDKKQLISVLAFFQFFNRSCPRLSEFTAPLRRLALPSVRFKPNETHIAAFESAKSHLMNSNVTAIRTPSAKLEDLIYLFCDASCSAIGCVLTQMQLPDEVSSEKMLYLIGTFSSIIPETWENYPPWLLELIALWETCRKYRWLLLGRNFIVCSDSSTVKSWSNLDLIPKDLSRKILALQQFSYKILFLESRANPSDVVSRAHLGPQTENRGCYPRFLESRIVNAKGEEVPVESLFCERRAKEIHDFFGKTRRQQSSRAVSLQEMEGKKREEYKHICDSKYERDQSTLFVDESNVTVEVIEREDDNMNDVNEAFRLKCHDITISAVDFDDQDLADGREEITEDILSDNDLPITLELPSYGPAELDRVRSMQLGDATINYILRYLKGEIPTPDKISSMALSSELRDFIRHKSNFRTSDQGVLFRVWISKEGSMSPLIVVGNTAFQDLLKQTHSFTPNSGTPSIPHSGMNRTMSALCDVFYTFKMRAKIATFISSCPVCILNNHVTKAMKNDQGCQISFEPMDLMIVDYLGPLNGWANTASGSPRYVYCMIDANTRFLITVATNNVGDDETLRSILESRKILCGLPKRVASDNAIFREHSAARKFLEEAGVSILHGRATISRDQSKVERCISSLTRSLCKLHTECPTASFQTILDNATLIHNCSVCRSTGKSPRELHFVRSASTFLNVAPKDVRPHSRTLKEAIAVARASARETLQHEIQQFIKRNETTSPTQFNKRLIEGQYVIKKRTSYPLGSSKKLCHKMTIDVYRVTHKVASNSYRVESLIDQKSYVLPGDLLVPLRHHRESDAIKLVQEMSELVTKNAARTAASGAANRPRRHQGPSIASTDVDPPFFNPTTTVGRRMVTSSRLGPSEASTNVLNLSHLFDEDTEEKDDNDDDDE